VKILALETSSARAGVAVSENGRLVIVRHFEAPRGRGAEIFTVLEECREFWRGADRLAVGIGPGSYNGLRVACALAGSFQLSLGLEVVAAPSPCLLGVPDDHYFAIGDARGGRAYWAEVRDRRLQGQIDLLDHGQLADRLAGAGAASVYRVGSLPVAGHLPDASPDPAVLAQLAASLPPADPGRLEPLYLKPPHITTPRRRPTDP
jgi:tRNA threonylcarbamoyladenosine biosynthesis protein TsaB